MPRRVYFFGGKGGVGKTTVSAAFALLLSTRGKKTLLISTDPAHSLADVLETEPLKEMREVTNNLSALEIDPYEVLKEYVETALENIEGSVSPDVFDQIKEVFHSIEETPGAEEAAVIERLSKVILKNLSEFDSFVIDTAPTGHTLQMLRTVGRVGKWLEELIRRKRKAESFKEAGGIDREDRSLSILEERRKRFSRFLELLLSRDTLFVPVLNPERLPILETERMVRELRRIGVELEFLVVNKVLPEETRDEFLLERKEQERKYLREIEERFSFLRMIKLPLRERDVKGIEDLKDLAVEIGRRMGI